MGMSEEMFNTEKLYGVTMAVAKTMLNEGLITDDEYRKISEEMLEKYKPTFGSLLAIVP